MKNNISKAIPDWERALGKDNVLKGYQKMGIYSENVSGLYKAIPSVIFPSNTDEVRRAVEIANEHEVSVYPISTGKNWGLGSRLPVKDGTVVMDLGKMKKIKEVNSKYAYAVIEPGVTQGDLFEHITNNNIPLIMDATGSGRDSSIIGNALERGVGYFTDRAEELLGLEVVLGSGDVIETGFGHYGDAKAKYLFSHGIGPSMKGLFVQSNCGVVTQAGIGLMHESDDYATFVCKIGHEDKLPEFIDALANLKKMGIAKSVFHVGNKERTRITLTPLLYDGLSGKYPNSSEKELREMSEKLFDGEKYGPWSATGRIFGTKTEVREAKRQIRKAMRGKGSSMFLTDGFIGTVEKLGKIFSFIPAVDRKNIVLQSMKPIYNFTKGIPTDDAIKSVYWPIMSPPEVLDPDHSQCGVLYYLPITPLDGKEVDNVSKITNNVLRGNGFVPSMTFNAVNERAMETVISIPFDRGNGKQIESAHKAVRSLHEALTSHGIYPYRVGIDMMDDIIDRNDPFWKAAGAVKKALDPKGVISPGRYNIY